MRKVIVAIVTSATMAAGAVAGLQSAAQASTARYGSADHALTRVVVARPAPGGGGCSSCRRAAHGTVRFEPNTAVFVDPAAALQVLAPIARRLSASRTRHAWLKGTTADVGPMSGQIALSKLRAGRVRAELITLGASPAQISTTGVGSDFRQFTPDRDTAGILLAGAAALNRSVRITLN